MSITTLMDGCWAMLTWHRLIQFTMRLFWGPQIPFPHWEMKICIGSRHEDIGGIWGLWYQKQVSQACISNCIPHNTVGCNYLCMPEISAPGAKLISGKWGLWHQKQVSQACISNCIPQNIVGCNYLCMPWIPAPGAKLLICNVVDCAPCITGSVVGDWLHMNYEPNLKDWCPQTRCQTWIITLYNICMEYCRSALVGSKCKAYSFAASALLSVKR